VNQIRQRDGGTWMTFKPGALFAVNKIKTREVSSTGLKTIHISRNPEPASSLANYVCTRLHHDESARRRFHAAYSSRTRELDLFTSPARAESWPLK
jgi:hypothetical protein